MNNSPNQPSQQLIEPTSQAQDALRVAVILFGATVVVVLFYFFLAVQLGAWQMFALAGVISAFAVVMLVSIGLIRRGRPILGLWLIIGGLLVIFPITSTLVAAVGLILGLALVLVVVSVTLTTQMLSSKQARWAIIASVLAGMATMLLDIFANDLLGLSYRLTVPELQTFLPVITGVVLLAYGFIILRQFRDYTLRTKLIITFLIMSVLAVGAVAFFANRSTTTTLTTNVGGNLKSLTDSKALNIGDLVVRQLDALRSLSLSRELRDRLVLANSSYGTTPEEIQIQLAELDREWAAAEDVSDFLIRTRLRNAVATELQVFRNGFPHHGEVFVTDVHGGLLAATNRTTDYYQADEEWWQVAYNDGQGATYVSLPTFDEGSNTLGLNIALPIYDNDNETVLGILGSTYRLAALGEIITSIESTQEGLRADLLFPNGQIMSSDEIMLEPVEPIVLAHLEEMAGKPYEEFNFEGVPSLVSQAPVATLTDDPIIADLGWTFIVHLDHQQALAAVEAQRRNIILLAVIIAGIAVFAAVVVSQRLSSPITRLTAVAQQVAGGDLSVQSPVESRDEIGQLAHAFNSMTTQLRNLIGSLEDQVRDRTAELALSIQVGQRASAIRDLDELLPTITEFIQERFDLYYTHTYFVDDVGQNLVIKAGTGEVGKQLLAHRHSLPVGAGSIVGRVAATGQPIVVSDTEKSDIHRPNPLLPRTRSELAVPLIVEERVIGVLDMQASRPGTFTENNLPVFEAMATQLAIAIDGAQQWAAAQEAQAKLQAGLKQLTHETWSETLASHQEDLAFTYDLSAVAPLKATSLKTSGVEKDAELTVPVVVQNESIGQFTVEMPLNRAWSSDEQDFLEAVVQQLAQKAETLRLFEDTQQRATREQLARQIVDKIRASRNIETALRTAVEELTIALGTARAVIDLKVAQVDEVDISTREIDP